MNVDEISKRLDDLSVEELQLVRDYEELNKKRESLLEQMDRKIRYAYGRCRTISSGQEGFWTTALALLPLYLAFIN